MQNIIIKKEKIERTYLDKYEFKSVLHPKSWTQDWRCSFYE